MVPDAFAYSTELVVCTSPVSVSDGYAYSTELCVFTQPISVPDAYAYSNELVIISPLVSTADAYAYSYENVANNANPTALKVWDGTQWVVKPYYVWNGNAWQQI